MSDTTNPNWKGGEAHGFPHGLASGTSRNHRINRNIDCCDDPVGYL